MKPDNIPSMEEQRDHWNWWDREYREDRELNQDSKLRGAKLLDLLENLKLESPKILEVGCANGWLCELLANYGDVSGIDLANEVIERAQQKFSNIKFVSGDFVSATLPYQKYDVLVSIDSIAHFANPQSFVDRAAELLAPDGHLLLTTQNRFVWNRTRGSVKRADGLLQEWLSKSTARRLISSRFRINDIGTIIPQGDLGILRLVNSARINRVLGKLMSELTIRRLKEAAGFGSTIYISASVR